MKGMVRQAMGALQRAAPKMSRVPSVPKVKVPRVPKPKGGGWMAGAVKRPGAFTAKAKAAKLTTGAFARKVLKPKSRASTRTKRQANLARTFAKFRP